MSLGVFIGQIGMCKAFISWMQSLRSQFKALKYTHAKQNLNSAGHYASTLSDHGGPEELLRHPQLFSLRFAAKRLHHALYELNRELF